MPDKFYVTTPIYYVNAAPHIGGAYTTIVADVLARHYRETLGSENVFFLTGTDEHGAKIQEMAEKAGKNPQEFVTEIADNFKNAWQSLNISFDNFIRTTNPKHEEAVKWVTQKFYEDGNIYKGTYKALYCVGCEQYKTKSELLEGDICPDHNRKCDVQEEEAYLFKMSAFQDELLKRIKNDVIKIRPESRKNEIVSFIEKEGLNDIAISRKKELVPWGIELPFDPSHTTYVWIDAFLNYLTGLGWPEDKKKTDKFWPADVQLMGKDIIRVHATIWQAMLLALGLDTTKEIFAHGFITSGGQKMSKSLGNVIDPLKVADEFGVDTLRYVLLREFPFGQDGDISEEKIASRYNSDLANDLGNLLQRTMMMINKYEVQVGLPEDLSIDDRDRNDSIRDLVCAAIETLNFDEGLRIIWQVIQDCNAQIENDKPWQLAKENKTSKLSESLSFVYQNLWGIGELLVPFMPETSEKIHHQLKTLEPEPLFPRLEK